MQTTVVICGTWLCVCTQVNYVVENLQDRETLQPLGYGEGEEEEEGRRRLQNVVVVGAGAAGLAAASTLKVCVGHLCTKEGGVRPAMRLMKSAAEHAQSTPRSKDQLALTCKL